MEFWNNIIHSAMIGTGKKTIGVEELPADLAEAATLVNEQTTTDKETKFLQLAALAFNYRQSGILPLKKEGLGLAPCPAEEKPFCSDVAMQTLKNILAEENNNLLELWMQNCSAKNQIVQPGLLPAILSAGVQQKSIQPLITDCCGRRGEWLSRFNEAWNFSSNQTIEERWQNGTLEQRKAVLKDLHNAEPAKAREWLQQTWAQEDAATKIALLEMLTETISQDDLPFLESLSAEKSKKVREEVNNLLKLIPGSAIVKKYEEILKQTVSLRKEKALLGLSSKINLHFQLPAQIDENIFKEGVEKLSSTKEYTDDEYIIFQLIRYVPPAFWEQHLNESFQHVIAHFQREAVGKKLFPAIVLALKHFNDHQRAITVMQYSETFYLHIIPLLPWQQQDFYCNKFFTNHADSVIGYASQMKAEWSMEFTLKVFSYIIEKPYDYTRSLYYTRHFYDRIIHLLPAKIDLARFTPPDDNSKAAWSKTGDYVTKLINLKAQTINAFNS